jgi:hypothetical protein
LGPLPACALPAGWRAEAGAATLRAVAKRPTKQQPTLHSWAVYHLKTTPTKFIGIVYDAPDAESAIKAAIKDFRVPPDEREWLLAQQRD